MSSRTRNGERGMAMVTVVLFAMVALSYTMSAITSGVAVRDQTRYYTAAQRAHEAAESGVHRALAQLSVTGSPLAGGGTIEGVLEGEEGSGVRYTCTLAPAAADGADNDQDGRIDEADEGNLLEVTSTGFCDQVMRTVRVTLLARYREVDIGAATYLEDPYAEVGFNGNAFLISGNDHDHEGNETGTPVAGIGVPGSPTYLLDQLRRQHLDNIVGVGGIPSVREVPALDLGDLIAEGARSASVTIDPEGGTAGPSEEGEWGTIESPTVVYAPGDIHISGGAEGSGILIVDGDLIITGNFAWSGLIIARGEVEFRGGGSTKRLSGALIVADTLRAGNTLEVSGTIDILFSSVAIENVMRSFATYTILNWREGAVPTPGS